MYQVLQLNDRQLNFILNQKKLLLFSMAWTCPRLYFQRFFLWYCCGCFCVVFICLCQTHIHGSNEISSNNSIDLIELQLYSYCVENSYSGREDLYFFSSSKMPLAYYFLDTPKHWKECDATLTHVTWLCWNVMLYFLS